MRDVEPVPRLAGALLTIGIHLARNPFEVLKIPLEGNHADDYGDWRLCTVTGSVTRKLSMHQDGWMPETDAQRNLVLPYLDELRLELPSVIKQILGEITLPASAEILFDLWQAVDAQKTLDAWFTANKPTQLTALNPSYLGNVFYWRALETIGHPIKVRLLGASSEHNLPGSCAYVRVTAEEAKAAYGWPVLGATDPELTVAGSLLQLAPETLTTTYGLIAEQLEQSKLDFAKAHNLFTTFAVRLLLDATGARPVHSPFESAARFNHKRGIVFIDDKDSGFQVTGRFTPVPSEVLEWLDNVYYPYLKRLCSKFSHLSDADKPPVIRGFESHLQRLEDYEAPLFCFVDDGLDWFEVTPSRLAEFSPVLGVLQANLGRQRYAGRLVDLGVPVEVVSAWMGHADSDRSTYGPMSLRSFADDLEQYRPLIDQNLADLKLDLEQFKAPSIPNDLVKAVQVSPHQAVPERLFGSRKRLNTRINRYQEQQEAVNSVFEHAKSIGCDLTKSQHVDQIFQACMFRERGLTDSKPQNIDEKTTFSGDRFVRAVGEDEGNRLRKGVYEPGLRVRVLEFKKHLRGQPVDLRDLKSYSAGFRLSLRSKTSFKPTSCAMIDEFNKVCHEFERLHEQELAPSGYAPKVRRLVVVLVLICRFRVADERALQRIMRGEGVELVKVNRRWFLQWHPLLSEDSCPKGVAKLVVDNKLAKWWPTKPEIRHRDLASCRKLPACVSQLRELLAHSSLMKPSEAKAIQSSNDWLPVIEALAGWADTANRFEFPGQLAEMLFDNSSNAAMNAELERRCLLGVYPDSLTRVEDKQAKATKPAVPKSEAEQIDRQFQMSVKSILKSYVAHRGEETAVALLELVEQSDTPSGDLLLSAEFVAHCAKEGRKGSKKPFAQSTLERYFGALVAVFKVPHRFSLLEISGDDALERIDTACELLVGPEPRDWTRINSQASALGLFLSWCDKRHPDGIDFRSLEWFETHRVVRATYLTEKHFQQLLSGLLKHTAQDATFLQAAFMAWLMFRFGLRIGETVLIRGCDVLVAEDVSQIRIDIRGKGGVKNSKPRVAFSLDSFSDIERQMLEQVLNSPRSDGLSAKKPLLARFGLWEEGKRLLENALLKMTGRQVTPHGLRHSYYVRHLSSLSGIGGELAELVRTSGADQLDVSKLGLQRIHSSPDIALQLATSMGHQSAAAAFRSYNHLMWSWLDALTHPSNRGVTWPRMRADEQKRSYQADFSMLSANAALSERASLATVFAVMRLLGQGNNDETIIRQCAVTLQTVETLKTAVRELSLKLRFGRSRSGGADEGDPALRFLNRLPAVFWRRAFAQADDVQTRLDSVQFPAKWQPDRFCDHVSKEKLWWVFEPEDIEFWAALSDALDLKVISLTAAPDSDLLLQHCKQRWGDLGPETRTRVESPYLWLEGRRQLPPHGGVALKTQASSGALASDSLQSLAWVLAVSTWRSSSTQ